LNITKLDDKDGNKVMGWAHSLSKISTGPADAFYLDADAYVTNQADAFQDGRCSAH
jgi:hypothetical protein